MKEMVTLDRWLHKAWLPPVAGAEKYYVLQNLTKSEAKEIMMMVAESAEFDMTSWEARSGPLYHGHPYRDFLGGYMMLMLESDMDDVNNWRKKLWKALPDVDKESMTRYARAAFGVNLKKLGCVR